VEARRAPASSRSDAPHRRLLDQRYINAYIYAAVEPGTDVVRMRASGTTHSL
jgi:hypothetical protein